MDASAVADELRALAERLGRLIVSRRDPERFHWVDSAEFRWAREVTAI